MPRPRTEKIHPISPAELREDVLVDHIYPDMQRSLYWSDAWSPDFYVALARAGFISVSHHDPEIGTVLVPELQRSYAVLDWENLHCSQKLRKLLRSRQLVEEEMELRVVDSCARVLEGLLEYHGPVTWLREPYRKLLCELPAERDPAFSLHGVELWSRKRDRLIAGELGYAIGSTYTSLSGFCTRDEPEWSHFGTLQIYWLAERLRDRGYAFWNMGHPVQPYKRAVGGRIVHRRVFLERWLEARDGTPDRLLAES